MTSRTFKSLYSVSSITKFVFWFNLRRMCILKMPKTFVIAAFGNPLLDITVNINNNDLLKKYNLDEDGQKEIPATVMKQLYHDISKLPHHTSPGGCAQNTVRVIQWLLQEPNVTVYYGGIGNDEQGKILTELVQNAGVTTRYVINEVQSSGTCIALVKNANRSLVANLGAAEYFPVEALSENVESLEILKSVKLVYLESYFLTKRLETARYVKEFCKTNDTVLAFNLSGSYVLTSNMIEFVKSCDILIGNLREYVTLAKLLNMTDPIKVAVMLSESHGSMENDDGDFRRYGKIIVITNGAEKVHCIYNRGEILEFNISPISKDDLKDTIGAGDSFAAGFIVGFLKGYDIEKCLKLGHFAALNIIQQIGCTIPKHIPNLENEIY